MSKFLELNIFFEFMQNLRKRNNLMSIEYRVEYPKFLNRNFNFEKDLTEVFIYRIQHVKYYNKYFKYKADEPILFCIVSATPLINDIPIKLLKENVDDNNGENSDQKQKFEHYKIIFTKNEKISKSLFEKLITFHHIFFRDPASFMDKPVFKE